MRAKDTRRGIERRVSLITRVIASFVWLASFLG